jgi:hypothetical protein
MKSQWTHKKYKSRTYTGKYRKLGSERDFTLSTTLKNGTPHNISFESWKAAKDMGWVKVK